MQEARSPGLMEENLNHLVLLLKRLDIADMGQCRFLDRPGELQKRRGAAVLQQTLVSLVLCSPRGPHAGSRGPGLSGSAG